MDLYESPKNTRMGRKVCAVDPIAFIGNVTRNK
jgi:hypothetical protein